MCCSEWETELEAWLQDYAKEDVMRIGAWIVVDGLLPLGPDFMAKIANTIRGAADSTLTNNPAFDAVATVSHTHIV